MKKLTLISLLAVLWSCNENKPESPSFEYPPEWEPHQAVWIDFHDDNLGGVPDSEARFEIIKSLQGKVHVKVLVDSELGAHNLDSMVQAHNLDTTQFTVVRHPIPNLAMRDAGPIFLSNGSELRTAGFNWNGYGGRAADLERGQVPRDLAARYGWMVDSTEFAAEGGGLEVNENVILSFKHHGLSRNPGKTLEEIEQAYLKMYNKEKMIWVEHSLLLEKPGRKIENYYGQGANQHIDAYMRFVNDSTILVPVISENEKDNSLIQQKDYEAIEKNLAQIKKETNTNGRPFTIVEIPMPDVSLYMFQTPVQDYMLDWYEDMEPVGEEVVFVPIMGYSNFLITNNAVLVSEYWTEDLPESEKLKDEKMKEILATYFPDREIIGIKNAIQLNWNGGGIHCQTQQEPRIVKN